MTTLRLSMRLIIIFFFRYNDSPLLVINTSDIDYVNRRADLDDLLKQILGMKQGTQYYVPKSRKS